MKKAGRRFHRIFRAVFAAALALAITGANLAPAAAVTWADVNELKDEANGLDAEKKELQAKLDALADEFHATAAEAMEQYPDQLNVAISLALAAGNLERTEVHVSPAEMVDFTIRCDGIFGEAAFYTRLGDSGPDLAAWSALAMLRRLTSPIVF